MGIYLLKTVNLTVTGGSAGNTLGIIYLDAFAHEKHAERSQELFTRLYVIMNPKGLLTSLCAKGICTPYVKAAGCYSENDLPAPQEENEKY